MNKVPEMGLLRRRHLTKVGRGSGDPATAARFLVIVRLSLGHGPSRVALELGLARSTVGKAAARFLSSGIDGLWDARRGNGAAKVDARFRQRLAELLRDTPDAFGWRRPSWTRELLCLQIVREGHAAVAPSTMGRVLARIGARLGSPKPVVLCPWPRRALESVLKRIRTLAERASRSEPVLYSDEVDIHLNPKIGLDWMLRGHQRRVVTPGKNEKFYLAGALDVATGKVLSTGAKRKNAALFCELLRVVTEAYPKAKRIHLVVDNYSVHKAIATKRALTDLQGRVVLHFLPPYCPDANRIERVWQDLHANVTRNHRCKDMNELLANCRQYLQTYRAGSVTGSAALTNAA
jgi:transposase